MTDSQILAVAITVLAVLAGTLINNSRIGDLRSDLTARIKDSKEVLRAEMRANKAESDARFDLMESKIDTILRMLLV